MLDVELVVVYHLVPTSNHNLFPSVITILQLFIILFLHQTTTMRLFFAFFVLLFIILFLHQTTTGMNLLALRFSCLSSCSYIKPQRSMRYHSTRVGCLSSCSYIKPQHREKRQISMNVVYHLVPTSNHNTIPRIILQVPVVYHLVPTSNHNSILFNKYDGKLFIILFLHQTTTYSRKSTDNQ